jgi:hypothetical protein
MSKIYNFGIPEMEVGSGVVVVMAVVVVVVVVV